MGIFGANKTASPTPTPSASAFDNDKRKYSSNLQSVLVLAQWQML